MCIIFLTLSKSWQFQQFFLAEIWNLFLYSNVCFSSVIIYSKYLLFTFNNRPDMYIVQLNCRNMFEDGHPFLQMLGT